MKIPTDFKYKRVVLFFLPFLFASLGLIAFWFAQEPEKSAKLIILMIVYFVPPFGKESLIPIGVAGDQLPIPFINKVIQMPAIDPLVMGLAIAFVDIMVGLFLLWNYDLAKKIPLIGNVIIKVENIGKGSSDKYAWIRPLRFIGIVMFVMVPFQGSGGFFGSLVGRLIGMKPLNVWYAVIIGSLASCLMIAFFADMVLNILRSNWVMGVFILVILAIIVVMIVAYRKNQNDKKKK
jgi:uncharacterized membrane protein